LTQLQQELLVAQEVEKERAVFMVIAAIGLIIFLVLLFWLIYLITQRRWAAVRENIACDIHDHLGANMMSVAHTLELLHHSQGEVNPKQQRLYKGAIRTARQSAQDTRQIVHFLEQEDSGNTWVERLREAASLIAGDIKLVMDFQEIRSFNKLDLARQWDLLLFIKEALNNSVKHSGASELELSLLSEGKKLIVIISDNGSGIPTERLPLRHLEMRAQRLKSKLTLETGPEQGTHIRLQL